MVEKSTITISIPSIRGNRMKVKLELSEDELKRLIFEYFQNKLGNVKFDENKLVIEVHSRQNYKAEWEKAAFRATYEHYEG